MKFDKPTSIKENFQEAPDPELFPGNQSNKENLQDTPDVREIFSEKGNQSQKPLKKIIFF